MTNVPPPARLSCRPLSIDKQGGVTVVSVNDDNGPGFASRTSSYSKRTVAFVFVVVLIFVIVATVSSSSSSVSTFDKNQTAQKKNTIPEGHYAHYSARDYRNAVPEHFCLYVRCIAC